MDQRLAVALPVLPAFAHAVVLRWEAAYHVRLRRGAGVPPVLRGQRFGYRGEPSLPIAIASLTTVLLLLAATIAAVMSMSGQSRRP
jgi:hypothetical protein